MAHRDLTDLDLKTFNRLKKTSYASRRRRRKPQNSKGWKALARSGGVIVVLLVAATTTYALTDLIDPNPLTKEASNVSELTLTPLPGSANSVPGYAKKVERIRPLIAELGTLSKSSQDAAAKPQVSLASLSYIRPQQGHQQYKDPHAGNHYGSAQSSAPDLRFSTAPLDRELPPLPEQSDKPTAEPSHDWQPEEIKVRPGDSLARIIARAGYTPKIVHEIMNSGAEADHLKSLFPGQMLTILRDSQGRFAGLHYHVDTQRTLKIERPGAAGDKQGRLHASLEPRRVIRHRIQTKEPLTGSLYLTARRAGLSDQMTMNLAGILSWEIDLGRELREHDRLVVIYDKIKSPDGELLDNEMQAIRYEGKRASFEAIKFETSDGESSYYNLKGENLRRELKRYPVEYTRISSHFDLNRRHPILGVRRPHLGVDLAAPVGTPIYAAGDGKVVEIGHNGGYGRVVSIKHGSGYRTLYAHLNGYARGLNVGDKVKGGEVIGYVGRSGTVTGPHLHYEVIVNGRHRDPVEVALPQADPLPDDERDQFLSHAKPLVQALREPQDEDAEVRLAANE